MQAGQFGGTLPGLLDYWASQTPDSPAIYCNDVETSFGALSDQSMRLASALVQLDVKPSDAVALWMPNCPAWMAVFFACARLGARVVALNTRFGDLDVQELLARTKAQAVFIWSSWNGRDFHSAIEGMDRAALDRLSCIVVCNDAARSVVPGAVPVHAFRTLLAAPPIERQQGTSGSGAVLFTTSGTSGRPKLVLHSQGGLTYHAQDTAHGLGFGLPDTVALQPMPLCGGYGLCQMLCAIAAGKPAVIQTEWNIEEMARLISRYRVTNFAGTDEMIMRLLATSKVERPFPSVRWCGYATFSVGLGDWFAMADSRGLHPVGLYGASEVQALYALQKPAAALASRCRDGGYPVSAHARVRVRDQDTNGLASIGDIGELELAGPSRMLHYEGDAKATKQAITSDGFVRIGDYGRLLEDGSFQFVGRMGDWIRASGFLVSPAAIEAFVESLPGVQGCQVVGAMWKGAQRPFAFVTLDAGARLDEAAIRAACAANLSHFKVPAGIEIVPAFPVTDGPNGVKIQKHVLRRQAADLLNGRAGRPN